MALARECVVIILLALELRKLTWNKGSKIVSVYT